MAAMPPQCKSLAQGDHIIDHPNRDTFENKRGVLLIIPPG